MILRTLPLYEATLALRSGKGRADKLPQAALEGAGTNARTGLAAD